MESSKKYFGGSFAPPITAEKLASYEALASRCEDRQVKDYVGQLLHMYSVFSQTGQSTEPKTSHPSGVGYKQPLTQQEIDRIWDVVPWKEDLDSIAKVFDRIDAGKNKPLRDAAFHLLWFAYELTADREPLTADRL